MAGGGFEKYYNSEQAKFQNLPNDFKAFFDRGIFSNEEIQNDPRAVLHVANYRLAHSLRHIRKMERSYLKSSEVMDQVVLSAKKSIALEKAKR